MAKQKAIVRKMNALEALGNITNICTDKTGTLTEGKMVVTDMYIGLEQYLVYGSGLTPVGDIVHMQSHKVVAEKPAALMSALTVAALCNTASITQNEQATSDNDKWVAVGEPTELALQVLATKAGVIKSQLEKELEFNAEFAFDSTIKRMSVVYKQGEQFHVFSKGAPEKMLELCSNIVVDKDGNTEPLNDDYVTDLLSMNEEFAKNGLRVLCLAYSKVSQVSNKREDIETQLTCIGFVGIKDPPRKEVYEAIQICREAGITVHMATGDQSTTAVAIAKQVGIIQLGEEHLVMTAAEFDKLTDEELKEMKELPVVIARCSPQSKVRLVKALHARKKHVAMTGDGVNDAPAIKNADVGIAMGKSGTDVTKQASDIVLTDDSFDTIITAIREGRRTFANMRKFVVHLLAGNVAETIALVITVLAGLMPSLYPTQVLCM
jgi:potassium/sodium efflux P-type ATPase